METGFSSDLEWMVSGFRGIPRDRGILRKTGGYCAFPLNLPDPLNPLNPLNLRNASKARNARKARNAWKALAHSTRMRIFAAT